MNRLPLLLSACLGGAVWAPSAWAQVASDGASPLLPQGGALIDKTVRPLGQAGASSSAATPQYLRNAQREHVREERRGKALPGDDQVQESPAPASAAEP